MPDGGTSPTPTPDVPPAGSPMRLSRARRLRVGELLLEQGDITTDQLEKALKEQVKSNRMLGEVLVEQGVITSTTLVRTLARVLSVKGCQLRHGLIDPSLIKLIGVEEAERLKVMPMFKVHGVLTVAAVEPQSLPMIDRLKNLTGCQIRPILALEASIMEFVRKYSTGDVDVDEFLRSLEDSDVEVVEREQIDEGPATDLDIQVSGSPVVNLVNVAFLRAVNDKASGN